jgi:hypothetical protein
MIRIALGLTLAVLACACDDAEKEGAPAKAAEAKADGDGGGALDPFTEYKRKSITSEALINVRRMGTDAASAHLDTGALPPSAPLTPEAGTCCKQPEGKCPAGSVAWDHPGWKALSFQIDEPHYYSYAFESTADGFVARAVGDLDCDGKLSTIETSGKLVDGAIEIGELVKTDPLE